MALGTDMAPGRLSARAAEGLIVGIDPGLSGALFFLDPSGTTGEAIDVPVHLLTRGGKKKRELDIVGLVGILEQHRPSHALIEQVAAMPGQGVSSVFAFGKGYGAILGVLAALRIPMTLVPPAQWKRVLGVQKSKDAARARASQLLPAAAQQWPLQKHDGRAESALLALYGIRQLHGAPALPGRPAEAAFHRRHGHRRLR
jgi:crossover junction endodeoxyribonuclease RuvC